MMFRMIQVLLFLLSLVSVVPVYAVGGDAVSDRTSSGIVSGHALIQVLDAEGQPFEGAFVTLYSDHGRTIEATQLTGTNGKVDFGKLDRESMSLSVVGLDNDYKRFDGHAIYDAPVRPLQISLELNDADARFSCDKTVDMSLNIDTKLAQGWQHELYVNGIKQKALTSNDFASVCYSGSTAEKAQIVVISTNRDDPSLIRYGYANDVDIKAGGTISPNDISLRQWSSDSQDSYEHFISSDVDTVRKSSSFNSVLNENPIMGLNDNNELTWKVIGTQPVYTTAYFQDKNTAEYMINWEIKSPSSISTIPMPRLPEALGQFAHTAGTQYIDIELEMIYSPDYKSITQRSDLYMSWLVDGGKKPLLTEESRSVSLFSAL